MKNCPECQSPDIQQLGDNFFCYDCNWSDLKPIEKAKTPKPLSDDEVLQIAQFEGLGLELGDIIYDNQGEQVGIVGAPTNWRDTDYTGFWIQFDEPDADGETISSNILFDSNDYVTYGHESNRTANISLNEFLQLAGMEGFTIAEHQEQWLETIINGSNQEEAEPTNETPNWQGLRATSVIVDDVIQTSDDAREALDTLNQVREEAELKEQDTDDEPSILNDIYNSYGVIGLQIASQVASLTNTLNERINTLSYHNNSREHQDEELESYNVQTHADC